MALILTSDTTQISDEIGWLQCKYCAAKYVVECNSCDCNIHYITDTYLLGADRNRHRHDRLECAFCKRGFSFFVCSKCGAGTETSDGSVHRGYNPVDRNSGVFKRFDDQESEFIARYFPSDNSIRNYKEIRAKQAVEAEAAEARDRALERRAVKEADWKNREAEQLVEKRRRNPFNLLVATFRRQSIEEYIPSHKRFEPERRNGPSRSPQLPFDHTHVLLRYYDSLVRDRNETARRTAEERQILKDAVTNILRERGVEIQRPCACLMDQNAGLMSHYVRLLIGVYGQVRAQAEVIHMFNSGKLALDLSSGVKTEGACVARYFALTGEVNDKVDVHEVVIKELERR